MDDGGLLCISMKSESNVLTGYASMALQFIEVPQTSPEGCEQTAPSTDTKQ